MIRIVSQGMIGKHKKEIAILLHNIRSAHNVGSMFRTADALGVSKIYLSGYTPRPQDQFGRGNSIIGKTALGAEQTTVWEAIKSPTRLITRLKRAGFEIVALEQHPRAVDYRKVRPKADILFIVGNEVSGVSKTVLRVADIVVEIPMYGKKESLNVSVAFGVALFRMLGK